MGLSVKDRDAGARRGLRVLIIAIVAFGLLAMLFLARGAWLPPIGGFLIVSDPLVAADAIVPLAGSRDRVFHAAEVYSQGYADWFITTNMPLNAPGIDEPYRELVRREAIKRGVPGEKILPAPGTVTTTYEEALAIRQLSERQGWKSLIVVTSAFHTRRSLISFEAAFEGSDIAVAIRPVPNDGYDAQTWWRSQDGLRETWTEYAKLVLHFMGYR
jgi:uncharacterized SAM-binding protein YcdF (DUF218 family)